MKATKKTINKFPVVRHDSESNFVAIQFYGGGRVYWLDPEETLALADALQTLLGRCVGTVPRKRITLFCATCTGLGKINPARTNETNCPDCNGSGYA